MTCSRRALVQGPHQPCRTQERRIDGLVITFQDISGARKLETELRATEARLQMLCEKAKSLGIEDG